MKTANYPGSILPEPGQVVGPNQLGEHFVGVGDIYRADIDVTKVRYELLTEERRNLLTSEARHEFVARHTGTQAREAAAGFTPVLEWPELGRFEREMLSPHLWDVR